MRQHRTCASIAVVVSLCSLVSVQGTQPAGDVPFELLEQHLIVVKGSVAGVRDLNLLIDTGTIPSVLDARIARKLRLQAEPSQTVAFGQTVRTRSASLTGLRIGVFEPGPIPVAIGDLSYLQQGRIDAIVGLDVLARTSFLIDYKARVLTFAPSAPESATVPLEVVWPFLSVRLAIAGHPAQLLVDTGSRDLVLFKSRMPTELLPIPWKGEKLIQHASGVTRLARYEFPHVTLGHQHRDSLPGFVLDTETAAYPPRIDGVLGVRALGGSRVRFDFERGELGWSPPALTMPPDERVWLDDGEQRPPVQQL